MDLQILFEQFINGITQGSIYALLALGFTMIFGTLRMVTFAHGEVYMMGAYVGFEIIRLLHPSFFLALAVALAATALLGVIIEILAFHFLLGVFYCPGDERVFYWLVFLHAHSIHQIGDTVGGKNSHEIIFQA